ncbi:hypothetical protein ACPCHQ_22155 [Ralstonia thomasii]|uniref:hypothetical protein n=1 Tax=Ralstonia thomasii TaxID=3058596 RepID=UPI003C2BB5C5
MTKHDDANTTGELFYLALGYLCLVAALVAFSYGKLAFTLSLAGFAAPPLLMYPLALGQMLAMNFSGPRLFLVRAVLICSVVVSLGVAGFAVLLISR